MPPTLRNYDSAELKRLDLAHHLPAQADHKVIAQLGGSRMIARAQGSTIWDTDGKAMLDGMAGLWCVNVGYGREELARTAYEQMMELPYYNTLFKTATPPTVNLAAKLAEKMGGKLTHVMFNASGSEANDTAFRLARHYWTLRGEPKRKVFISRWFAYHGSTVAGASLGGIKLMHAQGGLPIPGIEHVMGPYKFQEGFAETEHAFAARAAQAIDERIRDVGPENVAAFIGEPIMGAGGVIVPPRGYWPRVQEICRRYGILLICDEVICGFGRLGRWFGHHYYGVEPDLLPMAKGLSSGYQPISATGVADHIAATLREKGGEFVHGFTYSGHPVAAAVALKNIEIMEREHLIERTANETGPLLAAGLQSLADHPLVGEVRSVGLLGAIEIVAEHGTNKRFPGDPGTAGVIVRDICIRNGLMVRAIRDTIVCCPPLIITREEIARMIAIIRGALDEAEPQLRAL